MKFDQNMCKSLWFDPLGYSGKLNSACGSVVPLAMFRIEKSMQNIFSAGVRDSSFVKNKCGHWTDLGQICTKIKTMTITFNREIALKSWRCEQELLEHFHNILAQSEPNVLALLTIVVTKADRAENVRQSLEVLLEYLWRMITIPSHPSIHPHI